MCILIPTSALPIPPQRGIDRCARAHIFLGSSFISSIDSLFMTLSRTVLVFFSMLALSLPAGFCADKSETAVRPLLTIGIPDTVLTSHDAPDLRRTVDMLARTLPEYRWRTTVISTADASSALRSQSPDFLFAPAGFTLSFDPSLRAGLFRIAARRRAFGTDAARSAGAVILVRETSAARTLADLRGKKAAAAVPNAVDGWLAVQHRLFNEGQDPEQFFGHVRFLNNAYPDVISALIRGSVEAAVLPMCLPEKLQRAGLLALSGFRVISPPEESGDSPAVCARSTELFPDISLYALPDAPERAVRQVTVALLSEGLARYPTDATDFDWVTNVSESEVDKLYRDLRIGPYAYLRDMSLKAVLNRYRTPIFLVLSLVGFLLLSELRLRRTLRIRTDALMKSVNEAEALRQHAEEARLKLAVFERKSIAEQLSGMIAHEVNTPIGSIRAYVRVLTLRLKKLLPEGDTSLMRSVAGIDREAGRIADIIARVRSHAKTEAVHRECSLAEIIVRSVRAFEAEAPTERKGLTSVELPAGDPLCIKADALEAELLILNLLRNGFRAAKEADSLHGSDKALVVKVDLSDDRYRLCVSNAGRPVTDAEVEALSDPVHGTAKTGKDSGGLGLGLSICRAIAESHGSSLRFEARRGGGLSVSILLPTLRLEENSTQASSDQEIRS